MPFSSVSREDFPSLDALKTLKLPSFSSLRTTLSTEDVKTAGYIAAGLAASGTLIFLIRRADARTQADVEIVSLQEFEQLHAGGILRDFGTRLITPTVTAVQVTGYSDRITTLPSGIFNLVRLTVLNVSGNSISELPSGIGRLTGLVDMDVSYNKLTSLPQEIGKLTALTTLNAMGNELQTLPDSVGDLAVLYRLGLKSNKLTSLPASIGKLKALKELFLTDNALESFPEEIGCCSALVKVQASHNALKSLPTSLGSLSHLEMLRVACCDISDVPTAAAAAPALAWFSLAGNPACKVPSPRRSSLPIVSIVDVEIGRKLGDGASGEVFEAEWKGRRVAVKLFRADRSPDGQCSDEIEIACSLSDRHLIKVLAKLDPASPLGLIMEYVEGSPLAEKPNFESVLRCRWATGETFSLDFVVKVASGVASALEAMHARGIIHGDVYAHNVLADFEGNSVLCDYGAACYYPRAGALSYEGHEARAFGFLLRDLLTRMDIGFENMDAALDAQKQMLLMVQQSTTGVPADRPRMSAISRKLKSLQKSSTTASKGTTPRSDSLRNSAR